MASALYRERPDLLAGRMARCGCGRTAPSDPDRLAFFEYTGEESEESRERCANCGYNECAHDPAHMERLVPDKRTGERRPTVVEDGRCPGFEPKGPQELDRFYCGCRGWD